MVDQENDEEENLKVAIEFMPKWRILREPYPLRKTRHRIHFNSRAVKILDRRIRRAKGKKLKLLKKVRKYFKTKVRLLYKLHAHIMTHDLPWKPRRRVWAGANSNNAHCYKGESFNPEIWYEVKKEISRVERKIKEMMNKSGHKKRSRKNHNEKH